MGHFSSGKTHDPHFLGGTPGAKPATAKKRCKDFGGFTQETRIYRVRGPTLAQGERLAVDLMAQRGGFPAENHGNPATIQQYSSSGGWDAICN